MLSPTSDRLHQQTWNIGSTQSVVNWGTTKMKLSIDGRSDHGREQLGEEITNGSLYNQSLLPGTKS